MTTFQKIITGLLGILVCFVGYYFLVAMPSYNSSIQELRKQEIQIEKEKQKRENDMLEKEQEAEFEEKRQEQIRKEEALLMAKQESCKNEGDRFDKKYNNFHSAYYNEIMEECYIRYFNDDNIIEEGPLSNIGPQRKVKDDKKDHTDVIPLYGTTSVLYGSNFRKSPDTFTSNIIQQIDPTNVVYIKDHLYINGSLWYKVTFYDKEGWMNYVAFHELD